MAYSPTEQRVSDIISPAIEDMGYNIVRIKLFDGDKKTLQIMAERLSDRDLGVDDCSKISREISVLLDVEDPISSEYNLEVSSPGIDRPLIKITDFEHYKGLYAKIIVNIPIDGRKRYKGQIIEVKGDNIIIKMDDVKEQTSIDINNIDTAKLVITDELLARHNNK